MWNIGADSRVCTDIMTPTQRLDIAQRFLREGRYVACLRMVEPLTTRAPRTSADLTAQRARATASYALGHLGDAELAALRVVRRRPKDAATMRLLVRTLQRQGRHRDAAQWMSRLDALGTNTWDDDSAVLVPRPASAPRRQPAA